MSKFFEYVKKIELSSLITESSNTFSYNLPENRKQRLFDFYSFSSLSPLVNDIQSSELRVVKSFAPKKNEQGEASDDSMEETTSFRGARKLNENFVDSFWKAHDKCYVELAKEMLMDIFYCISAEFKHISQDSKYNSEETINKMPEDLREIYKNYLSNDSGQNNRYSKNPIKVPEKKGESGNGYNERYEKAVRSVAMAGKSIFDFAKLCSYVYDNFKFSGSYGGPPWSDAANAFIGIANALPEKYRSANIFKSLGDPEELKDLESSTDTEVPSKDESKKTKYNFDINVFFGKLNQATNEQKEEIANVIAEIQNHFSPHNSTKSWKIINKTTKEDIIPLEIKVNEINGKYVFNLLLNHDNFEGYFENKISDAITNRFKEFLDPHKETLNKVFGKIEGKSKFNQIYNKASTTDQYEIILLIEELTKYFEDLKQQEISNFEIYDVEKWEDIFGGNKPKEEEINNLIANYNTFTVVNSDANKVPTDIHSTIRDNINNIFDKYKTVLNKLFGKKQTEKNTDTEKKEETEYSDEKESLLEKEKNVKIFKQKFRNAPSYEKNTINILIDDLQEFFEDLQKQDIVIQIIHSINGIILYTGNKPEDEDIFNLIVNYNNIGIIPVEGSYTSMYEEIKNTIGYYFNKCKTLLNELFGKKQTEEDAEEETESISQTKSSGSYELSPKERLALFVAIDHTWGLSHNTGPTFNKLKEFTKLSNDGRGMWLVDSLDKRTKDENLFRFINKNTKKSDVSPQIASLIKRIVYSYYGATNEEELYQYVAKTNPNKQVPIHVSNTVYRYIKPNPSSNIYKNDEYFGFPYDIEFNSHYNYWCSLTFKIEYKPFETECIIAVHVTDHNVTILASDKKDFSFTRDGIQSSGEYVESKKSFTVKDKDDSDAIIAAYKTTLNSLTRKIVKYEGVRIDPDYTSVLSELEMGYDEFKEKINLNSDISLRRITEYGDDLKLANSSVKFQIGDEGLDFIMPHVVMTFVNAERQEETPDVTYGSPDAEEYFAGKRKKPKKAAAIPNIRFSFLAKPEISKTFQFTDDVSTNMKNVIYGYVSKINETGDEGLKRLQKSAVEDFQLADTRISDIDYNSDVFVSKIPEKYKKIFNQSHIAKGDEILIYGEHDYKFIIELDKGRLTNPYSVNLLKNEDSIIDKAYRYDSIETIQKNFAVIVEDMVSNIKDSEKEEFQNLFKSARSIKGQTRLSVGEPKTPNTIGIKELSQKYGEYLSNNYPNYSVGVTNYCIDLFEKISVSINKNPYFLKQYFQKLSILFKYFYDEFDSKLIDVPNFDEAQSTSNNDIIVLYFKPISNFSFKFLIEINQDVFTIFCADTKNNKLIINDYAGFTDKQGMVELAILVNKEYDKMVAKGGTTTQPAINNTQNVENLKNSLLEKFINFGEKFKTFAIMADIMFEKSMFIPLLEKINNDKHNIQKFSNFLSFIHHISKITEDSFDDNHIIDVLLEDEDRIKIVYGTFNTINYVFLLGFNKDDSNILFVKATEKDINFIRMMKYDNIPFYNYLYIMCDIYNQAQKLHASEKIKNTYEKSKAHFKNTNKNEPLNDSVNLKELLKSFLLKG